MDVRLTAAAAGLCVLAFLWTGSQWTGSQWSGSQWGVCVWGVCVWSASLWQRVPGAPDLPIRAGLPLLAALSLAPVLAAPVLLGCSLKLIGDLRSRRLVLIQEQEPRHVLITGCDSGFGLALAQRLARPGVRVVAGVLDPEGAGPRRLRGRDHVRVVRLDVTDERQVESVRRLVDALAGRAGLWGLVNNAGVMHCPADAELLPPPDVARCLDVNFLSAARTCRVFLPLLRRARGRIVNVSSLIASAPMPMLSAYAASKAALSAFSHALRAELRDWGVAVALIQPGGFRTNIFGDAAARHGDAMLAAAAPETLEAYGPAYVSSLPGRLTAMARDSAPDLSPATDAMIHALLAARPRAVYSPGGAEHLLSLVHGLCPAPVYDLIIGALTRHPCRPAGRHPSRDRF